MAVRYSAAFLGLVVAGGAASAQSRPAVGRRVETLVAAFEARQRGTAGVSALDIRTGQAIAAVRADDAMMPASNQKLLTSAFALVRLGPHFRFVTGVFRLGEDLVVAGEGDPTLGDTRIAAERGRSVYADLDEWAAAVRAKAGGEVRDVIVCEPPTWPGRHPDWEARHGQRWYAVPVGTLNFHDNCFDVTFARAGGVVVPVVHPQSRFLRIVNRLQHGKPHLWGLRTADEDATVVLTGKACNASDSPQSVSVERPALLLGRTFADRLVRAGVAVGGRVRQVSHRQVEWSRAEPVARTETPLFAVMRRACKKSLNLAAEAMFLRAGDGTWAGSAEMMRRVLTRRFALRPGSVRPADGGGLSRGNRVRPSALAKLLAAVAVRPDGILLLHSLPVAGVDGTLERRFRGSACRGRVIAKTGYIAGVSTLSGYILDEDRRPRVAFSILVNGRPGILSPAKRLQEDLCEVLLAGLPRREAPAPPPR